MVGLRSPRYEPYSFNYNWRGVNPGYPFSATRLERHIYLRGYPCVHALWSMPLWGPWGLRRFESFKLMAMQPVDEFSLRTTQGDSDGYRYDSSTRFCFDPEFTVGATHRRHHLHGHGRQLPVRLDALRRPNRRQVRLEQGGHPGHVHSVRSVRDVAGTRGRVAGR